MQSVTGHEFWWSPSFCSVIQLQKSPFFSKISNPCLRNHFSFYREKSGHAQIVLRCHKS